MKKTIGILGGMGPLATVELFRLIVKYTDSRDDQGHIHILIDNNPQIPDRTQAILNGGESPVPALTRSAILLKKMGADFLLVPCNTSHYYFNLISNDAKIEVVNMIDIAAQHIKNMGIKTVGLLATSGSVKTGIYKKTFSDHGINMIYPSVVEQDQVMEYIYNGVKAGNEEYPSDLLEKIVKSMIGEGAEKIVLGCTELSIGFNSFQFSEQCVDPMTLLAKYAIQKAGYRVIKDC